MMQRSTTHFSVLLFYSIKCQTKVHIHRKKCWQTYIPVYQSIYTDKVKNPDTYKAFVWHQGMLFPNWLSFLQM